jgi:hypothetical protein
MGGLEIEQLISVRSWPDVYVMYSKTRLWYRYLLFPSSVWADLSPILNFRNSYGVTRIR